MCTSPAVRRRPPVPTRPRPRPCRHHRVAVALTSLAMLGAWPTIAHAGEWHSGPNFDIAAGSVGGDFAAAPDGSSTAAWVSGSHGVPPVLQVQRARPDGTVAAPLTLGTGSRPALAMSTTGMTAVAWIGGNLGEGDRSVRVTLLDALGTVVRTTTVATLAEDAAGSALTADVAVDATGNATVVWTGVNTDTWTVEARAAFLRADGGRRASVGLGETVDDPAGAPTAVAAPDGTTWIGWLSLDDTVQIARWDVSGAVDVPPTQVSAHDDRASAFRLVAGSAGAALAWVTPDPSGDVDPSGFPLARIDGIRLPATGALAGAPFRATGAVDVSSGGIAGFGTGIGLAVAPGGAVSLGSTRAGDDGLQSVLTRFARAQATADAVPLGASHGLGTLAPAIGGAPDGSLVASWLRIDGLESTSVVGVRVAPDGTIGTASTITSAPSDPGFLPPRSVPQAGDDGRGMIGVATSFPGGGISWSLNAFRLGVGPAAPPGDPDPGGDDGETTPPTHERPTPAPPTVLARTPGIAPPTAPRRVATGLRISRATRSRTSVSVVGRITSRATGNVTVSYVQQVGRRTIRVRKTATVADGRWRTTLRLPRTLTRRAALKVRGTTTVGFAGTPTVRRATTTRTTTLASAPRPAPRAATPTPAHPGSSHPASTGATTPDMRRG